MECVGDGVEAEHRCAESESVQGRVQVAQPTLTVLAAVRPDLLSRTVIVITDGPGDIPGDEHDIVERFSNLKVPVCRMPYEPLFAGGKRIALSQLRRQTRDALTVLASTAIGLMGRAAG